MNTRPTAPGRQLRAPIMKYCSQHTSLFLFRISILLQSFLMVTTAGSPPATGDIISLDCGSSGNSTASDGRNWTGDIGSNLATIQPLHTTVASKPSRQAADSIPYQTARISSSEFTYTIPIITAGPKLLRLYFYPTSYQGFDPSAADFSVKSGPYTLLSNFRSDSLGAKYLVKEFSINVGKDHQSLNLTFSPFPSSSMDSYSFVNGIEIVSTPPNLYYTPPGGYGVPFLGQTNFYEIERSTVLETMFRLNVGGQPIPPTGDCGLLRFWSDDNNYFTGGGVVPDRANNTITYTKETPAYIAPAEVYQTYRSMGPSRLWNLRNNLTWELPVDLGFKYLIRIHLCETDPDITQPSDRLFTIYIDGQMAEHYADAIGWSGGNSKPAYRDYLAMIGYEGTPGKYNLSVELHAREVYTRYSDAILNGIEVFKLNSTSGGLEGPNPESLGTVFLSSKAPSNKKATFIVVGVLVAIGLVLVSLRLYIMFLLRRDSKVVGHGCESKFTETITSNFLGEVCLLFPEAKTKGFTNV